MDVADAVHRWNELLERTFLLREECQRLRHEAEGATEVRGGPFTTLRTVAEYIGVLEAGLRKAMDDVKKYRDSDKRRGLMGEEWLKRMDGILGPDEERPKP
jgi:hypothetical protein